MAAGLPIMKSLLTPLAKSVLLPLRLSAEMSAADAQEQTGWFFHILLEILASSMLGRQ